jgi:hypothetical protein
MAKKQSGSNVDSLRLALQDLVSQVGLVCGELELVIHEGAITSIKVRPEYRVVFSDTEDGISEPRDEIIRLNKAESFIRARLEKAIVERIGRFGRAKMTVRNGLVSDWHLTRHYKYTG